MQTVDKIADLWKLPYSASDVPVGFVPTMGCLHAGHMSLVEASKKTCNKTVVSIFVNPTQFAPNEDLDAYPRPLERDKKLLEEAGVDLLFLPNAKEMYAEDASTYVNEQKLSQGLCGAKRSGHFQGVTTVVAKLFNIVRPDITFFGQKDLQQARIIQKMVSDLDFKLKVELCPTVREPDGLAMSSRNNYLAPDEREVASRLYQSMLAMQQAFRDGENQTNRLIDIGSKMVAETGKFRLDYLEVRDFFDLTPLENLTEYRDSNKQAAILVAAYLGKARLIDNLVI